MTSTAVSSFPLMPHGGYARPLPGLLQTKPELYAYLCIAAVSVGDQITVSDFKDGEKIDASGVSRGRGFSGVVKRWHFAGGPKTHGQSDRHRAPGSIGSTTTPGRIYKGKHMAGHMGNDAVTIRNLVVLKTDAEKNLLMVKGAIPGGKNTIILIKKTGK
ncbi:50S ribosomal protein L3 [Dehalococcoides mccartyi]|uniref:50S ribosomal protein L3 n=1 Tax=Dehalococcoides mccartyi TaxID=61435 RepID=A0A2J1DR41_9CHLR|nr:50S ribosomal protein L3 [Dehalococcoides mccartyi]